MFNYVNYYNISLLGTQCMEKILPFVESMQTSQSEKDAEIRMEEIPVRMIEAETLKASEINELMQRCDGAVDSQKQWCDAAFAALE